MAFTSVEELVSRAQAAGQPLWRVVLEEHMCDRQCTEESAIEQMRRMWQAMVYASQHYSEDEVSPSGLSGTDATKLMHRKGQLLAGEFMGQVMTEALKMAECNACMKRIVAAPTAGSCAVLPAVLIAMRDQHSAQEPQILQALFVAAAFGQIIATRASISGAAGGCQAEIGTASGMAAAALVALQGGTPEMSAHACAFALKSLLGLVCDPVAGLVEVPCVKRNVLGAVGAVTSADMALAGIESRIPCDEVIDAMREVGDMMPHSLRETGEGGLAATPTGKAAAKRILHRPSSMEQQ